MSYTIEYERVFLKSKLGYTALWLHGDNNVYEPSYDRRHERRSRNWGVMCDFLGVSEEHMLKTFERYFNDYDEHWRRNGKFLTNKQTINWIKTGCRNAVTVEELREVNRSLTIEVHALKWQDKREESLKTQIKTTDDLDNWIVSFKEFAKQNNNKDIYPIIDLYPEMIKKPIRTVDNADDDEKFYIKYKDSFITESKGTNIQLSPDRSKAKQFTTVEVKSILDRYSRENLKVCKVTDDPYDAIVKLQYSSQMVYLSRKVKSRMYTTVDKQMAHRFRNAREAENFIKKNKDRFSCEMSVEIVDSIGGNVNK